MLIWVRSDDPPAPDSPLLNRPGGGPCIPGWSGYVQPRAEGLAHRRQNHWSPAMRWSWRTSCPARGWPWSGMPLRRQP